MDTSGVFHGTWQQSGRAFSPFCSSLLPREVVESPSRETSQTHLGAFLCHLLQVPLSWQGAGLDDVQKSLPTPAIQ